jgi:translation initiation factor 2 beta subunit (eIF-2beta)/eIF-5
MQKKIITSEIKKEELMVTCSGCGGVNFSLINKFNKKYHQCDKCHLLLTEKIMKQKILIEGELKFTDTTLTDDDCLPIPKSCFQCGKNDYESYVEGGFTILLCKFCGEKEVFKFKKKEINHV